MLFQAFAIPEFLGRVSQACDSDGVLFGQVLNHLEWTNFTAPVRREWIAMADVEEFHAEAIPLCCARSAVFRARFCRQTARHQRMRTPPSSPATPVTNINAGCSTHNGRRIWLTRSPIAA